MPANTTTSTNHFDAARLARQNWQQDGCPPGREGEYYRMAESQIQALQNLLAYDRKSITSANARLQPAQPLMAPPTDKPGPQRPPP